MTIPATLHDVNAGVGMFNAPQVVRDVAGDFEITVKVVGAFKPGKTKPNVTAGALLGAAPIV